MKPDHARVVCGFRPDVHDYLISYFGARPVEPDEHPTVPLAEIGAGQADCVLALLRAGLLREAELLVGRRVTRCPPCLRPTAPPPDRPDERHPDARRVRVLAPDNPRHPSTGAYYRFAIFRSGMTVQQFLTRGGTRRDVRAAVRRGWIELSG